MRSLTIPRSGWRVGKRQVLCGALNDYIADCSEAAHEVCVPAALALMPPPPTHTHAHTHHTRAHTHLPPQHC
jgi:hypothetical protein